MKYRKTVALLTTILLGLSVFASIRVSANVQKNGPHSISSTERTYTSTSSGNPNPIKPYRRSTFVYSDPESYLDEYAFIASVPANVFRDESENLYAAPIIYGDSAAGDYLLDDWKTYCDHWGGVDYLDFVGPYGDDYKSSMKSYFGAEKSSSLVAVDPYEYAADIALKDWTNSSAAVIAPAKTRFPEPEPLFGEFHGEFFNITEDYMVSYEFGIKLGPPNYVLLSPPIESPHPYPNSSYLIYPLVHPGADQISVHFWNISMEWGWDYIEIYDKNKNYITSYTGYLKDVWTPPVQGDTVYIVLSSDSIISDWGFLADAYTWWVYRPPLATIHRGEWLNFTVPANITGIVIAEVQLLNWTWTVGETWLTCFFMDPDGNVVDYDFTPASGDYTWMMWDINERPRTTTENYSIAIYCLGYENASGDWSLLVGGTVYGFSGKLGNLDIHTISIPENAKELDAWLSCNSTLQRASYLSMWAIDPEGNVFFPNFFEFTDTEYPPAPIFLSDIARFNAPYPTPGNWTLIVEAAPSPAAPPRPANMTLEYTVQYRIQLYNEETDDYLKAAANGAVIASLKNVPVLYTAGNSLPEQTVKALRILGVDEVIFVDPAGKISIAVKTAVTDWGITISQDLTSLEQTTNYIQGLSGETDLILTLPTGNFFAPAALAGAFHGAPVLSFIRQAKEIPTLADSTWAYQYFAHEFWGISPVDFLLKAPPIHWMHELSEIWSEWIGGLGADATGMESVLVVAPLVDVKPVFERAIQGVAKAGRIPGDNAEEDVAFINRAMLYPAIIYANPGYDIAMPTCVSYDYGLPDIPSDISPNLIQPPDYMAPPEYVYPVNGWDNITTAMQDRNFTLEPHVGKYVVYKNLTDGVAFWYHSNHGGLGFVWDYIPFGQGGVGLWYDDPPDPQPKRGYEYNMTTLAENASVPDQYNLYGEPYSDGAVYQYMSEPFSFAYGGEFDRWLGNIHSVQVVFMDCYIGGSMLPLTMIRHGAASVIGDMRTGLLIDTDWFCVKYTQEVMAGKTLGEAFVTAVQKTGYVYPNNYFDMTLFRRAWVYNYTVIPDVWEEPWYAYPYIEDCSNAYVLYGDPDMIIVDPTTPEPEAFDTIELSVNGHDPDHAIRSISISLMAPASETCVRGNTTISWTISLQNTVLEYCFLYIDETRVDATDLTSYTWNTANILDGRHTITLILTDLLGNISSKSLCVIVDNAAPVAEIRHPLDNAYLRSTCEVDIYGYDANLKQMRLSIDGVSKKNWTESGLQTFVWDTTMIDDNPCTMTLVVEDEGGNSVGETVVVTLDNTEPSVSITSPEAEAQLSGTVIIEFEASDANLESAQLIIDNSAFDVIGETSYEWDTSTVGDGDHTIKLIAYDKAGNTNQTSIAVDTVNVKLGTETTRNLYLGIGIPLGLVIGATIIYLVTKRLPRKKP